MSLVKPILLFLILTTSLVHSQQVVGIIVDAKTNAPLEGASIYFEGSTYGTISDGQAKFILATPQRISSQLVITFIGYKSIITQPVWDRPVRVQMEEETDFLDEVILRANPLFSRKEMLDVFRREFLGETAAAARCKILNEDDVFLTFDEKNNTLIASADRPLIVTNKYLDYKIKYKLDQFCRYLQEGKP